MGARGFFGGLFGVVNSSQDSAIPAIQSGIYSLDDQYYSKQDGGWWIPYTGTVTGGTVYPGIDIGGSPYNIHKFTHPNSSTLVIAGPPTGGKITDVDITVVAGGGGGGGFWNWSGGGGGGGGVRHVQSAILTDGTYPISVGDGAPGDPGSPPGGPYANTDNPAFSGESSIFNPGDANAYPALTATGGGYGGTRGNRGGAGGSGGGKSYPTDPGSPDLGNAGGDDPRSTPVVEGFDATYAQNSAGANWRCEGGGGAGGTLTWPPGSPTNENAYMKGTNGLTVTRLGSPGDPWLPTAGNVFGGGGGGSSYKLQDGPTGYGEGGSGGGGDGGPTRDATANTGGGGGGSGQTPTGAAGGTGGEGIVYIRVPGANTSNPG